MTPAKATPTNVVVVDGSNIATEGRSMPSLSQLNDAVTAFTEESPKNGPSLTFTALIPDLHHYKGSFGGRAYPLWAEFGVPNMPPSRKPTALGATG